jgi:Integrase core domain/CHC2 zinc finger
MDVTMPFSANRADALHIRARDIVKALGGHWSRRQGMCLCPAHDDRTPSLSIGVSHSAILFHCFAGCSSADVLEGLKRHGVKPRDLFDGKGNCYDNSAVETFFKSLKAELIWRQKWPTRRQAEAAIFQYINGFYNSRRRHSYLGGISPLAFEAKVA